MLDDLPPKLGIPLAFVLFLFVCGFIVERIGGFTFAAIWLVISAVCYFRRNPINWSPSQSHEDWPQGLPKCC